MRGDAAGAQGVSELGDVRGGLRGDGSAGAARPQRLWVEEHGAQHGELAGRAEIIETQLDFARGRGGEVGADNDAIHVARDEQGRIFEVFAVLEQLIVGGGEVFVFTFVFDGEETAFPDIGPAVAAAGFGGAALEREAVAGGIGLGGRGMAHQRAQVEEVLLCGGTLSEFDGAPFVNELEHVHGEGIAKRRERDKHHGGSRGQA